jgi:hypothetical protein
VRVKLTLLEVNYLLWHVTNVIAQAVAGEKLMPKQVCPFAASMHAHACVTIGTRQCAVCTWFRRPLTSWLWSMSLLHCFPPSCRFLYYGAWTVSGVAIVADITTKVVDAPKEKKVNTAVYHTAFHIPASLVIPAVIIHKVRILKRAVGSPCPMLRSAPHDHSSLFLEITPVCLCCRLFTWQRTLC